MPNQLLHRTAGADPRCAAISLARPRGRWAGRSAWSRERGGAATSRWTHRRGWPTGRRVGTGSFVGLEPRQVRRYLRVVAAHLSEESMATDALPATDKQI